MSVTFANDTSVKERILVDIKKALEGVKRADGYHHDIQHVHRFSVNPIDFVSYPLVTIVGIREDKTEIEGSPPRMNVVLTVTISCVLSEDPADDSETSHNYLLRDIETALQQDYSRGGIARDTVIVGTDVEILETEVPLSVSSLAVQVKYQHDRADPTQER
jgi:hypothetical protein